MNVMTFNVLCAGNGENHWCRRQRLVRDIIKKYNPDTFGLQEAHYGWMKYICNAFRDTYSFVGVGKDDGGIKGEFSPVFYKKDKFKLLGKGDFWLSQAPQLPGLGWDAVENRTCSYAVLKDRLTGEKIVHFNTHLDHVGTTAMLEGAKLIIKKTEEFNDIPIVVTGDFNVTPDSAVYGLFLASGFCDARSVAECTDDVNSFHWYGKSSKMIDFIFIKNIAGVKSLRTVTDKIDGKLPSDHYPVVVEF